MKTRRSSKPSKLALSTAMLLLLGQLPSTSKAYQLGPKDLAQIDSVSAEDALTTSSLESLLAQQEEAQEDTEVPAKTEESSEQQQQPASQDVAGDKSDEKESPAEETSQTQKAETVETADEPEQEGESEVKTEPTQQQSGEAEQSQPATSSEAGKAEVEQPAAAEGGEVQTEDIADGEKIEETEQTEETPAAQGTKAQETDDLVVAEVDGKEAQVSANQPVSVVSDGDDAPSEQPTDADTPPEGPPQNVDPSQPLLYYSRKVKDGELAGLTHWILYSDPNTVYAANLVNGEYLAQPVISGEENISAMAVDSNQGYLFVAVQDDEESSHIDRYQFTVDNKVRPPVMAVNASTKLEVYLGKQVVSLAVDADQSIVYVADSTAQRIDQIQYDPKTLDLANTVSGVTDTVYEDVTNFADLTSVAVDYLGNIFWTVGQGGNDAGSIMKARADVPSKVSQVQISKALDGASNLVYQNEFLIFSGKDDDVEGASDQSAVFYKSMPKSGDHSLSIKKISTDLSECVGLGAFDSYIYVADSGEGIMAIESFGDDIFSTPRKIPLVLTDGTDAPSPTTMVAFTLGALSNLALSFAMLSATIALTLF